VSSYNEGPFSAEEVATFLEKMATIKDELEEKTKADIVSSLVASLLQLVSVSASVHVLPVVSENLL